MTMVGIWVNRITILQEKPPHIFILLGTPTVTRSQVRSCTVEKSHTSINDVRPEYRQEKPQLFSIMSRGFREQDDDDDDDDDDTRHPFSFESYRHARHVIILPYVQVAQPCYAESCAFRCWPFPVKLLYPTRNVPSFFTNLGAGQNVSICIP